MRVSLLETITLKETTTIYFKNGYSLELPAGMYYTCAFGVVIDIAAHKCIACKEALWKIENSN